jgi:hypothetical protein
MLTRALAAIALLSASSAADADALLDRLLIDARTVDPGDLAWTRTTRTEQRGAGEAKVSVVVERYDPSRPTARRWMLSSIDGRAPTAKEVEEYAQSRSEATVPGYARILKHLGGKLQRDDASGHPVYRGSGLPKGAFVANRHDLSAEAKVEAHVAPGPKPFVERIVLASGKPFRMMLVAKVDRVEGVTRYKLMPDGRPVPAEQVTIMTGSMMGKSGTIRTVSTYSDHRPVQISN